MNRTVVCIGAAMVDELFFCHQHPLQGTSNPATVQRSPGGVISNIALHLGLLQIPVQLITILGNDSDGSWLTHVLNDAGVDTSAITHVDEPTGKYVSILDPGGALFTAACADIAGKYLSASFLEQQKDRLLEASMIVGDTNISIEALFWLSAFCKHHDIPLLIEPVSVAKAEKLSAMDFPGIHMITPNEEELASIVGGGYYDEAKAAHTLLDKGVKNIWVRKGEKGSAVYSKSGCISLPASFINIVDSTGAGDAALAGWLAASYRGYDEVTCMQAGHAMAFEVLQVKGAIISHLQQLTLPQLIEKYYGSK
jgi:pseudouridine kinase